MENFNESFDQKNGSPRLVCPGCCCPIISDSLTEIFGFCCLNEGCHVAAIVKATKQWILDGMYHRIDGPAIEYSDGTRHWYVNGVPSRVDGPAIEDASGNKYWYLNGVPHRIGGPAVEEADGHKVWILNGNCHREDGPAIEYANGDQEWWLNGNRQGTIEFTENK